MASELSWRVTLVRFTELSSVARSKVGSWPTPIEASTAMIIETQLRFWTMHSPEEVRPHVKGSKARRGVVKDICAERALS
jgi:hypothetical protein